jgi:hypothetical protein
VTNEWDDIAIRLDGDGSRPQGVIVHVNGRTYRLDDRVRQVAPGVWEVYGPPDEVFREGDAGWFGVAPDGHTLQLVTEDCPQRPGFLQFRQPPCERPS